MLCLVSFAATIVVFAGCGLIADDSESAAFNLPEPPKISQAAT